MEIKIRKGFLPHIIYICVLPAFFLLACLVYDPFGIKESYTYNSFSPLAHLALLTCIILLTLVVSRLLFWLWRSKKEISMWGCIAWAVIECFAASCFIALYTSLTSGLDFASCLQTSAGYTFTILPYPYLIIVLVNIILQNSGSKSSQADSDSGELMKFYDEHGKLKLMISSGTILFIKAEDNYIKVHYLEGDTVKMYELRNSMRSLEETAPRHGIYRCHRSYYVSPAHVKVLRKDKEGLIYAELNRADIPPIPVSKRYYDSIASLL